MRSILILRGLPASGKSTWVAENNLENYTLSLDKIRLLISSPELTIYGKTCIDKSSTIAAWKILNELLEKRMELGEFTVVDGTASRNEIRDYVKLAKKYKYRIYCVDFTDVRPEVCKQRNINRKFKTPEKAIDTMSRRFKQQKIPSCVKIIKPNELYKIWMKPIDLSGYKKIHHIGDVHGSYTVLKKYIGTMRKDEFYIFLGDYIDRGIENAETLNFLFSIMDKENVCLLEGNHEKWLWKWANNEPVKSPEFTDKTKPELERKGVDKKQTRIFYRRLASCMYYTYNEKTVFVSHGGISCLPSERIDLISTSQLIYGVGKYGDYRVVDNSFLNNTKPDVYQVHGHRNTEDSPIRINEKCFDLDGRVEAWGNLRALELDKKGFTEKEIPNDKCVPLKQRIMENPFLKEKKFGDLLSVNFRKSAFGFHWNKQFIKANAFYIDSKTDQIVARSYDKLFTFGESIRNIQHKITFPLQVYTEENGFIGIVGYDTNRLVLTSGKNPRCKCSRIFRKLFFKTVKNQKTITEIIRFMKHNNVSLIFKVIEDENGYDQSKIVLLDIVKNTVEFQLFPYAKTNEVAQKFGFKHKTHAYTIKNLSEFYNWLSVVKQKGYKYNEKMIKGFVIRDSNNYMFRVFTTSQYNMKPLCKNKLKTKKVFYRENL